MHWLVPPSQAKTTKLDLENRGYKPKIQSRDGLVHLYVPELLDAPIKDASFEACEICTDSAPAVVESLPKYRYSVYPPLVLFSSESIDLDNAQRILTREKCTHAAINRPIPNLDIVRRPQIEPLIGDFGVFDPESLDFDNAFWCTSRQNGIFQTWAPLYTMFSRGNVTEKKRVLEFKGIEGTTVVDLYCGIGYFTFSYAKNNPKVVYGWELNPWSIEGLRRAAGVNKWNCRITKQGQEYSYLPSDKLVIFAEDNANAVARISQLQLQQVSHINMGLLPDCKLAWDTAKTLSTRDTIFHVHENVHENDLQQWTTDTSKAMGTTIHVEKIKQFSPAVWHVCGDFSNTSS